MTLPHWGAIDAGALAALLGKVSLPALAGKIFIDFADSLLPPQPTAGYWTRVAYNFVQKLASNGARTLPAAQPPLNPATNPAPASPETIILPAAPPAPPT